MNSPLVVMGVSGSGKTEVGTALAARLGAAFKDADDLHPLPNVEKMTAGIPLTDEDNGPGFAWWAQNSRPNTPMGS